MELYLNIAQIIVGAALITFIVLFGKSGSLGSMFGGADSAVQHTRRGTELLVFRLIIGISVLFFLIAILSVIAAR